MVVHKLYGEMKMLWTYKGISRYRCTTNWKNGISWFTIQYLFIEET